MRARIPSALVASAVVVVGLAGCGGDDGGSAEPDTTLIPPESAEVSTETPDTTAAPDATSGSEPAATAPRTPTATTAEARDAVEELKAAWEAGDRTRAAAIAPGDVVDALFAVPPEGYEVQGCDTGEFDTSSCTYRNRATEAFIAVTAARTEAGWQIATIDVNVD